LFSQDSESNFYWVNPALSTLASARELFAGAGWQNTGGDRTWLSPEIDLFFPAIPIVGGMSSLRRWTRLRTQLMRGTMVWR
jgi:hypothetical protein